MNAATILNFPEPDLLALSKQELVFMVSTLRAELKSVQTERSTIIASLQEKLAQRDAELEKLAKAKINSTVNQPSSKQPEFNKDTGTDPDKKKRNERKREKAELVQGIRQNQHPIL